LQHIQLAEMQNMPTRDLPSIQLHRDQPRALIPRWWGSRQWSYEFCPDLSQRVNQIEIFQ
jgi:hypothetical protein